MNKIIWISAVVLSVAACAKNEVIPVNSGENQEITFNVAPKTKADPAQDNDGHKEFGKGNVFASWAYYLPTGTDWINKSDDPDDEKYPKEYISGAEIAYREKTEGSEEKVWKAQKTYYWPKNGTLTFFAYSLYKENLKLNEAAASMVTCNPFQGIYANIDLSVDKNVDFLVADIKADQKANTTTTGEAGKYYTDGVPTLFRHRLSYLAFNVKTDKDYSAAGKKLELKSITFNNISSYGEYRQFATEISGATFPSGFRAADATGTVSYTRIPTTESPFTMEIKSSNTGSGVLVSDTDNFLYIPQTFAKGSNANENAYIEVKYTITTTVACTTPEGQPSTKEVVEEVTKNIFLNPATGTPMFDKWEMGKKYTINLTFTLEEILWDPAVEDWEDVTPATDHIVE